MSTKKKHVSSLVKFALTSTGVTPTAAPVESKPESESAIFREMRREEAMAAGKLRKIPLALVDADPQQPRRTFDEGALLELAETIKVQGVIQPPTVRPHPTKPGRYMLVVGERRTRACRLLDIAETEFVVEDYNDTDARIVQLLENSERARQNVRPWEEALALRDLVDELGSATEVVNRCGLGHSHISKRLALLDVPAEVADLLSSGRMTDYETALALAKVKPLNREVYDALVKEAKEGHLKRAKVLAEIKRLKDLRINGGPSPAFIEQVSKLRSAYETKVSGLKKEGVKISGLDLADKKRGRETLRLTIEFDGYHAADTFLKTLQG